MSDFDNAVRRWVGSATSGNDALTESDYRIIRDGLVSYVRARHRRFSADDCCDVAQEALTRFARVITRVDAKKSPAGYLIVTTNSVLADRFRKDAPGTPFLDGLPTEAGDDAVARLLEQITDAERVRSALRRAAERKDLTTVKIVGIWLDLAAKLGRAPSSREVATRASVSKTAVNDALARFKNDLL